MRLKRAAAAALLALAGGAQAADEAPGPWRFSVRSVHHADALALRDLGDDAAVKRLDPRSGRNIAYVDDEARLERQWGPWRIGVLARASATLVANRETLALVRELDADTRSGQSAHWPVRLRYEAFQGAGLSLQRDFAPAAGWTVSLKAQGLQLRHWRERRLDGALAFDAATGGYSFDLRSSTADDRLDFPFRADAASRGLGLLFASDATWRGAGWRVGLGLRDVGVLRWKRMPREDAVLSTETRAVDADGFVVYEPLLQGRNSQDGHTRRVPGRAAAVVGWQAGPRDEWSVSADVVPGFGVLPALGWQGTRGAFDLGLHWHVHERRLALDLGWRGWRLRVGADRADGGRRSREWGLSAGWAL